MLGYECLPPVDLFGKKNARKENGRVKAREIAVLSTLQQRSRDEVIFFVLCWINSAQLVGKLISETQ